VASVVAFRSWRREEGDEPVRTFEGVDPQSITTL
jgi:hypothetical protein